MPPSKYVLGLQFVEWLETRETQTSAVISEGPSVLTLMVREGPAPADATGVVALAAGLRDGDGSVGNMAPRARVQSVYAGFSFEGGDGAGNNASQA